MITGSSGFIGGHLLEAVGGTGVDIKEGNDIRVCELPNEKVIFHCAAQASIPKSLEDPLESYSHNVEGTIRILKHALKTGASVVFSSSSSVYELTSPYAEQKAICEEFLETYWDLGVKSIALRYFNVFGERQEIANEGEALVLARFLAQHKRGEPFTIYGNGLQRRDFVYVKDVVDANIKAAKFLKTATKFEVIDIGSGVNHSINDIADMINKDHPRLNLPPRIEPFENKANLEKAKELLGWEPKTTLESWLRA